jgi:hypothetical protein
MLVGLLTLCNVILCHNDVMAIDEDHRDPALATNSALRRNTSLDCTVLLTRLRSAPASPLGADAIRQQADNCCEQTEDWYIAERSEWRCWFALSIHKRWLARIPICSALHFHVYSITTILFRLCRRTKPRPFAYMSRFIQ